MNTRTDQWGRPIDQYGHLIPQPQPMQQGWSQPNMPPQAPVQQNWNQPPPPNLDPWGRPVMQPQPMQQARNMGNNRVNPLNRPPAMCADNTTPAPEPTVAKTPSQSVVQEVESFVYKGVKYSVVGDSVSEPYNHESPHRRVYNDTVYIYVADLNTGGVPHFKHILRRDLNMEYSDHLLSGNIKTELTGTRDRERVIPTLDELQSGDITRVDFTTPNVLLSDESFFSAKEALNKLIMVDPAEKRTDIACIKYTHNSIIGLKSDVEGFKEHCPDISTLLGLVTVLGDFANGHDEFIKRIDKIYTTEFNDFVCMTLGLPWTVDSVIEDYSGFKGLLEEDLEPVAVGYVLRQIDSLVPKLLSMLDDGYADTATGEYHVHGKYGVALRVPIDCLELAIKIHPKGAMLTESSYTNLLEVLLETIKTHTDIINESEVDNNGLVLHLITLDDAVIKVTHGLGYGDRVVLRYEGQL